MIENKVTVKFVKDYLTKRLTYNYTIDDECSDVEREILTLISAEFSGIFHHLREFDVCKVATLRIRPYFIMADSSVGNTDSKEYHRILKILSTTIAGEVNNILQKRSSIGRINNSKTETN